MLLIVLTCNNAELPHKAKEREKIQVQKVNGGERSLMTFIAERGFVKSTPSAQWSVG